MGKFMYQGVRTVHTLGPTGTNLEAASRWWRDSKQLDAEVRLHSTLEVGVENMAMDGSAVLVACIVYPELHTLVFKNVMRLEIAECFVFPTHHMVLASRDGAMPSTLASHPAPHSLAPTELERVFVNSNAQAAIDCAKGLVDGCITTLVAANANGLKVLKDYGSLPMGFSIHVPRSSV
jgi:hypothetical protein